MTYNERAAWIGVEGRSRAAMTATSRTVALLRIILLTFAYRVLCGFLVARELL